MRTIQVKSGSAGYSVFVGRGLLSTLSRRLVNVRGKGPRGVFVLTSPEIWSLWADAFLESFPHQDPPSILFLQPGEEHKRLRTVERLAEQLAEARADRSSLLIAFGGGIVGDVGGFLAAIFMRGIDYVQVPTTLLAQVDSSVGGKTGVNLQAGKNLVGCFHHPLAVFADTELLQTLPSRELRAGLFESVKAGIIRHPKLFGYMERNAGAILARDPKAIEYVVSASIQMKAEVVGIDELENGLRMILNYGHTLGHAIEAATRYRKLLHGEAVAWGMIAATRLGLARQTVTRAQADRIEKLIFEYGPLPSLRLPVDRLLDAATRDKKNRSGVRRVILPSGIGNAVVVEDVTDAELHDVAESMLRTARESSATTDSVKE
ncbi:3-dehydroquinate synthase [Acidisarcina polymorpha]|uniref:3-dehydroquinate synthase n=1 Tax=Acidisarcina polymorpha TaxID=2211140 RepID=A0A2Z5FXX6_9BACT|nr:3-dehydroquinate synthase [Acidisarcina polymorpha]